MKNLNANNNQNLIGRKIEIELEATDKETLESLRRPVPQMPIVTGILVKRFCARNWGYILELNEPLLIDREGIELEARKKYSTKYLMIKMAWTDRNEGKDPIYLELSGREPNALRGDYRKGESYVGVGCVPELSLVPNEIDKNDPFWKDNPVMCTGWVKLID